MKKRLLLNLIILVLALTVLPHCGGGGGGGSTGNSGPTTAVITLSTTLTDVLPVNTIINGYDVTITLPAGVTVKSTDTSSNPQPVDSSVLTATSVAAGSSIAGAYSPAAGGTPGTVKILIVNGSGISAGEFCKVTCNIAAGYHPSASDFAQSAFAASGLVRPILRLI
jgi:hypothetical protein